MDVNQAASTAALAILIDCFMDQPITSEERSRAIAELIRTREMLLEAIEDISESNAVIKPTVESWNVLECLEHLTLTERGIFVRVRQSFKNPVSSDEERASTTGKTEMLSTLIPERTRRIIAPPEASPKGKFKSLAEARAAFVQSRKATISFLEETNLPLHSYVTRHPVFGELDAYQWFIFMAAHVERHTKQLLELKATF